MATRPDPLWRRIYAILETLEMDEALTYASLDEIYERPFVLSEREPVYRAIRELERCHQRTMVCVPNVGYRVAKASEHAGLAMHAHRKALKQKTAALSKAKSADRAQLDQEARRRLDALELQLQRSLEYESRITRRLVLQERNLLRTRYEQQVLQHRLDAIKEVLQRHGLSPQPGEERQQPA